MPALSRPRMQLAHAAPLSSLLTASHSRHRCAAPAGWDALKGHLALTAAEHEINLHVCPGMPCTSITDMYFGLDLHTSWGVPRAGPSRT